MAQICSVCGGVIQDFEFDDEIEGPWDCENHTKPEEEDG